MSADIRDFEFGALLRTLDPSTSLSGQLDLIARLTLPGHARDADALVFIAGLLVGTFAFAGLYGPAVRGVLDMGMIAEGDTFTHAFGVAEPLVLAALVAMLVAVFFAGSWFERRGPGPVNVEQAVAGAE
jgi:hypothetical protein